MKRYAAEAAKGKTEDPRYQVIDLRFSGSRIVRILMAHGAPQLSANMAATEILGYIAEVIRAADPTRPQ